MNEVERRLAGLSPAKRELLRQAAARQRAEQQRIKPRPRPPRVPLTHNQRRLWLLDRLHPGLVAYNSPVAHWLAGPLERDALRRAVQALLDRHEALRTRFVSHAGEPYQQVEAHATLPWRELDAYGATPAERREHALALARAEASQPFDLAHGPLLRAVLIAAGPELHLLLLTFHHVAIDGWSITRLLGELEHTYAAARTGQVAALPAPELQIADVALWQQETLGDDALAPQLEYWREQLAGAATVLDLPSDRPRPALPSFRGAHWRRELPERLCEQLERVARERQATLSMVFLAAYQCVLARYTGQDDIVVAMGVAGRARVELEPVVGFFVNTLALRTRFDGEPSFAGVLARVREAMLGAMANADAPLDRVLEALRVARTAGHTPFAQALYFFQSYPPSKLTLAGLELASVPTGDVSPATAQGDLSLFIERDARWQLAFEYSTDLYDQATIERLAGHLVTLLEAVAQAPETPVATLPLLTAAEHAELARWNATGRELPREATLAAVLAEQAARSPDAPALSCAGRTLSYREIDQRGNALAHALREAGVRPGALVGLYVERTPEMAIGLLGILKAGAGYVPLDPGFPAERLSYMLEVGAVDVLVTQAAVQAAQPLRAARVVMVDALAPDALAPAPPAGAASPEDLAYVLFTSGSTGKPKGVEVRQRAAVNLLRSVAREPGMRDGEVICAISTLSFDIALFELVLPLTVGACILLVEREVVRDGPRLRRLVESSAISIMQATPATWRMLLELGWRGTPELRIVSTGEALPRELAERLLPCGRELWNLYGPTETTVYSTLCRVQSGAGPILVGHPVDNTQIHIVDRHLQHVPVGVAGELLIGGEGVARGYRARPDLTAEKFIPDPFTAEAGARLYRSGDLARWRADGTIEVLGRLDHQVKLRGFRIELGEIETLLAQHPAVTQAVVHCREDAPGDKRLVAYLSGKRGALAPAALREYLKAALPDYMVPSAFVVLERFPLTPNGKVDRRALPAPEADAGRGEAGAPAPRTAEETQLLELWRQLLPGRRIEPASDFFELGGHSLLAAQMLARIDQSFGVELPLRALFEAPTIAQLAARIADARGEIAPDQLEALLRDLEHLSEEDASRRLEATRTQSAGDTP
jgi:amino acid adenylation domain-containing protein